MSKFEIPIMVLKDAISEANLAGMEEQACRSALAVLEAADKVGERDLCSVFMGFVSTELRSLLEAIRQANANQPDRQARWAGRRGTD